MKVIEVTNTDFALRHFLLPLMRAGHARGHEMIGLAPEGPLLDTVRAEGFRVIAVPFARRLSPYAHVAAFRAMVRLLRDEKPDLVHAHMLISGFLTRLAARRAGVPRIAYTSHGFHFREPSPWPRRAATFAAEWLGGRFTDITLTVSADDAAAARRLGIASRAEAVGNGRDPSRFRPDPIARTRVRTELGTPPDRLVVVIISRLARVKGYPELLAAMRALPEAELWVVGERLTSDHGRDLAPLFASSGLGDRLKMLGYREDTPAILAAADIFVLPSHFEGLPMVVIEAMLAGLPVIATDIPGPREQVVPGVTGLLVPRGEVAPLAAALQELAADPARRMRMGMAGRARAMERYDEAKVLTRTLDLLGL
ncbi:MAG TPA: glycosyltransferase family 4 protein [Acetobacteraceae bacterium]|nr:glycosyltransferase family 4 protein [Acetobacteraceae bacterium]